MINLSKFDRSPQNTEMVNEQGMIFDPWCTCSAALRQIPVEESILISGGTVFKAEIKFTLANNATRYLAFVTPPATAEVPRYVEWWQDYLSADVNNLTYRLWEGANFTPGAAQPVVNQNRALSAVVLPFTLLYPTPTAVTLAGAVEVDLLAALGSQAQGAGRGSGGAVAGQRFMILKPNTKYVIELFNDNSGFTANLLFKSVFIESLFPGLYAKANP